MKIFKTLKPDFLAGTTVALILIPQSLAYAQLAGLPVQFGLYASLLPPLIASALGSSKYLATGPVAILSLMTFAELSQYYPPGSSEYVGLAIMMALLLGIFQISLGVLKLGNLINFVSHPVIYGFTSAAAIIIALTQLSRFLNISVPSQEHVYETVFLLFQKSMLGVDLHTIMLGVWSLIFMILLRNYNKKLPVVIISVIISSILAMLTGYTGPLIGEINIGLPTPIFPKISVNLLEEIFPTIITMGLIGFTEAISIAKTAAIKTSGKINPNKELFGQGAANVIGSFFQSYPVAGSFSRTAVNLQAGAKSKMSGIFTSLIVLVAILFFSGLLKFIPQVILASIIIFSVAGLVDLSKIKNIWSTKKMDGISALLTFFGTLYYAPHLEKGILLGVLFSIAVFFYKSFKPNIIFVSKYKDGQLHDAGKFKMKKCTNIAVVRLDSRLFFANASYFEEEITNFISDNPEIKYILIVSVGINDLDSTGEEVLRSLYRNLHSAGKELYFAYAKTPVRKVLKRTGFMDKIGHNHFFTKTDEAVEFLITKADNEGMHIDTNNCPLKKYVRDTNITENKSGTKINLSNITRSIYAYVYQGKSGVKSVDSKRRL